MMCRCFLQSYSRALITHGRNENWEVLVRQHQEKRLLEKHSCTSENNIIMDRKEIGFKVIFWNQLVQELDEWRDPMKVNEFLGFMKVGEFLSQLSNC